MKNDPQYDPILELSWRRDLSAGAKAELAAWLKANPSRREEQSVEFALTDALVHLPDAPVPSNFTACILDAVKQQVAAEARSRSGWDRFFHLRWLPRLGFASVLLIAGALVYQREHLSFERREYAQSIATVSDVASMPSPEILQNFEAIRRLNQAPAPDEQLLTLLQ